MARRRLGFFQNLTNTFPLLCYQKINSHIVINTIESLSPRGRKFPHIPTTDQSVNFQGCKKTEDGASAHTDITY